MKKISIKTVELLAISWLLIIVCLMPFVFYPFNGTFDAYIPRFLFLLIFGILFSPIFIVNTQFFIFNEPMTLDIKLLLIYFLLIFLSTLHADDKLAAIIGYHRFDGLLVMLIYLMIFFVAKKVKIINRKMIFVILGLSCIICLHAILQKYKLDPIPQNLLIQSLYGLSYSTMAHPNHLGSFIVILLPFSIHLYIEECEKSALVFYCILFYALLCTSTRGAWVGACISLLAYLYIKKKYHHTSTQQFKRFINVTVMTILLFIVLNLSENFESIIRVSSIFTDFNEVVNSGSNSLKSGSGRIAIWGKVIDIIKSNPILGIGIENLGQVMNSVYREELYLKIGAYQTNDTAHNEYLQIAVTSGIPSLITFLGFLYISINKSIIKSKTSNLYLPVTSALFGYLAIGMFNNSLIMFEYLIWVLLGFASSNVIVHYSESDLNTG